MSKKVIIFIVILVGIIGYFILVREPISPGPTQLPVTTKNETKDWKMLFAKITQAKVEIKTFSDETEYEEYIEAVGGYGIEAYVLRYPKEWQVETESVGLASIVNLRDLENGSPGNNYIVFSIVVIPNQGGLTLEQWYQEMSKQSGYKKAGTTSIAGFGAFKLEVQESEAGSRYAFFTHEGTGGWIFDIQTVGLDEETINLILSTFEFIESK